MQATHVVRPPGTRVGALFTFAVIAGCCLAACREQPTGVPVDAATLALLSPDVREKLEDTRVPVWLPATLARMQPVSMTVADGSYEWSAADGNVRIRLRGEPLDADRIARVAVIGEVESHVVGERTITLGVAHGPMAGDTSYGARWVEGNALYSLDVSCVPGDAVCETNSFVLDLVQDLVLVWSEPR